VGWAEFQAAASLALNSSTGAPGDSGPAGSAAIDAVATATAADMISPAPHSCFKIMMYLDKE
jgi:hypothetical protein